MSNSPFGNFAPSCGWCGGNPNNQCLSRNAEKREGKEIENFYKQFWVERQGLKEGRTAPINSASSAVLSRWGKAKNNPKLKGQRTKAENILFLIEGQNHNSTTYQISVQEGTCPQRMRESRAKILDCLIQFTFLKTQTMLIWNEMS